MPFSRLHCSYSLKLESQFTNSRLIVFLFFFEKYSCFDFLQFRPECPSSFLFSVSPPCFLVVIDNFFFSNLCHSPVILYFYTSYECISVFQDLNSNCFFLPFALVCELDFLGHHRLHPHAHNTKLEVVSCILSQTTDRRIVISCPTRLDHLHFNIQRT